LCETKGQSEHMAATHTHQVGHHPRNNNCIHVMIFKYLLQFCPLERIVGTLRVYNMSARRHSKRRYKSPLGRAVPANKRVSSCTYSKGRNIQQHLIRAPSHPPVHCSTSSLTVWSCLHPTRPQGRSRSPHAEDWGGHAAYI